MEQKLDAILEELRAMREVMTVWETREHLKRRQIYSQVVAEIADDHNIDFCSSSEDPFPIWYRRRGEEKIMLKRDKPE